jgi:hypothetical protein
MAFNAWGFVRSHRTKGCGFGRTEPHADLLTQSSKHRSVSALMNRPATGSFGCALWLYINGSSNVKGFGFGIARSQLDLNVTAITDHRNSGCRITEFKRSPI